MSDKPTGTTAPTNDVALGSLRASTLSVSLSVGDLRRSLAWYRDVLGFTVAQEFQRAGTLFAVSLRAGVVPFLLTQDDGAKGVDRVKGEGFSMQLTTAQDIDELARGIQARGGVIDSEPADARGARVFRLRDLDGFRLVISSERAAPAATPATR